MSGNQPGLFSKVCGVLSYFGMGILRGQALTNRQGLVIDVFEFTDGERFFELNPSARSTVTDLLADIVGGWKDIDKILLPKQRGLKRRGPPRMRPVVHFDNGYSERFSILEVVAQDAWGLLYRISRVISQHECDIEFRVDLDRDRPRRGRVPSHEGQCQACGRGSSGAATEPGSTPEILTRHRNPWR